MRAMKLTLVLAGLLASTQYIAAYYNSSVFNDFVSSEAQTVPLKDQLRAALLSQAAARSLRITKDNIVITTSGSVFRVAVDYSVPVNLLVYSPELKFHAVGSGFLHQ